MRAAQQMIHIYNHNLSEFGIVITAVQFFLIYRNYQSSMGVCKNKIRSHRVYISDNTCIRKKKANLARYRLSIAAAARATREKPA